MHPIGVRQHVPAHQSKYDEHNHSVESLGLPLPGETMLVLAAIYAATEPSFNIWVVIAVAALARSSAITSAIGSDQDTAMHFYCDTASVLAYLNPVSSSDSTCS